MKMEIINGGVLAAKGFLAASCSANIKAKDREDMALLYSMAPCGAAGCFTKNIVKAAPVLWDQKIVRERGRAQAVVINSGIANACTGEQGMADCRAAAERAGAGLEIEPEDVLVASTGVIGMRLPTERILRGIDKMIPNLHMGAEAGEAAAKAILTTDTKHKEAAVEIEIGGKWVRVGGMAKGSGMIHPDMCTMLAFVTTDIAISKDLLAEALTAVVEDTYNMVSVDGDTSTNDSVLLLANGEAGNDEIREKNGDYEKFCRALLYVNTKLAKMIAGDGEGATALIECCITGAVTKKAAKKLCKSVICSTLTKAAVFGHDANWGRIICALGYSGAGFDPFRIDLNFESEAGEISILKDGTVCDYSEEEASRILSKPEVRLMVDLKLGEESATAWGCDLSYEYVRINADYRS